VGESPEWRTRRVGLAPPSWRRWPPASSSPVAEMNKRAGMINTHGDQRNRDFARHDDDGTVAAVSRSEDEYRVAAADPGGEAAPAPAPGFGEADGESDIIDDTPESEPANPTPERPTAEIPFRTTGVAAGIAEVAFFAVVVAVVTTISSEACTQE
jgi:hypothetical protein